MPAYCSAQGVHFRISYNEFPAELPLATSYWIQGYLVGSVPRQPDVEDDDDPRLARYLALAEEYFATGRWPPQLRTLPDE